MSESKKMDVLNDMFLDAENTKIEFGEECHKIQELLKKAMDSIKEGEGDNLLDVFKSLKSFLESANGTMKSIEEELREIASDCSQLQMDIMTK